MASALPFAMVGALAAPLAWAIGRDAGAPSYVSVGAGVLVAFPALSFVYMAQPDNFSLYQPLVAGSLFLAARGLRGNARAFALAGLLAGLATLSRNDGVLVLARAGRHVPVGPLANGARVRRRARAPGPDPARRRAGGRGAVRRRRRALVPAPAGGVRDALALHRVRQGAVHPGHRRVEQHHDPGQPGPPPGHGLGAAADDPGRRAGRGAVHLQRAGRGAGADPVPAGGGMEAAARRGLRAVLRLCRPAVRLQRAGLGGPRARRDLHPLGGGPRAPRLRAGAVGHRVRGGLGRAAAGELGHRAGRPCLRRRGRGLRRGDRGLGLAHRAPGLGREAAAGPGGGGGTGRGRRRRRTTA